MLDSPQNIAVLGSTGSIGSSTLEVVAAHPDKLAVEALTAHRQLDRLVGQAQKHSPRFVVAADEETAASFDFSQLSSETELLCGPEALEIVASHPEIDTVVAAIVGSAGLRSTWAALQAGKRVALANKETMVVAGPLVQSLVESTDAQLIPVDSEHSAIFQGLAMGRRQDVQRIYLTASGGPFRDWPRDQLDDVTVEQALAHPTWQMGVKISIDSATMMNKALEIIEARWLFDLQPEQIQVVVHPQSVVHSMVEFVDGAVVAQLSPPDMRLPIQYALSFPERWPSPAQKCDFTKSAQWQFDPPDPDRFPAIALGMEVAKAGGTAGAVMNAANEAAVEQFIDKRIKFTEIVPACRAVLEQHHFDPRPNLAEIMRLDQWAREEVTKWICA